MPKIHSIGPQHFVQYIKFPVKWEWRLWSRGWTQEIEKPFRTSEPLIFRMPLHKALVVGKWTGRIATEEEALSRAIQGRVLQDEDFQQGWQPPAYEAPTESGEDWDY